MVSWVKASKGLAGMASHGLAAYVELWRGTVSFGRMGELRQVGACWGTVWQVRRGKPGLGTVRNGEAGVAS